jgi:hypothetical protein
MDQTQLQTGLDALTAAAEASNPAARSKALFEKANAGTATPEEREELLKSLGGSGTLAAAATAPLQTEALVKSVDVSPYIKEQHAGVVDALTVLADRIEKGEGSEHQFRCALATSVVQMGEMVKSLSDQVAALSGQPAGPVLSKGLGPAAPVERPIAGQPPAANKLSKSEVLDVMQTISQENGGFSKGGENMSTAIAKYEIATELSKGLAQEVMAVAKAQRSPQAA